MSGESGYRFRARTCSKILKTDPFYLDQMSPSDPERV
jgi:hypothetical protein